MANRDAFDIHDFLTEDEIKAQINAMQQYFDHPMDDEIIRLEQIASQQNHAYDHLSNHSQSDNISEHNTPRQSRNNLNSVNEQKIPQTQQHNDRKVTDSSRRHEDNGENEDGENDEDKEDEDDEDSRDGGDNNNQNNEDDGGDYGYDDHNNYDIDNVNIVNNSRSINRMDNANPINDVNRNVQSSVRDNVQSSVRDNIQSSVQNNLAGHSENNPNNQNDEIKNPFLSLPYRILDYSEDNNIPSRQSYEVPPTNLTNAENNSLVPSINAGRSANASQNSRRNGIQLIPLSAGFNILSDPLSPGFDIMLRQLYQSSQRQQNLESKQPGLETKNVEQKQYNNILYFDNMTEEKLLRQLHDQLHIVRQPHPRLERSNAQTNLNSNREANSNRESNSNRLQFGQSNYNDFESDNLDNLPRALMNILNSSGGSMDVLRDLQHRILDRNNDVQSVIQRLEGRPLTAQETYDQDLEKARHYSSLEEKFITYNLTVENGRCVPKKFNDDLELINNPKSLLNIDPSSKQHDVQIWFERTKYAIPQTIKLLEIKNGSVIDEFTYIFVVFSHHIKLAEYYLSKGCIIFGSFALYMIYCAKEKIRWQDISSAKMFFGNFDWLPMDIDVYYNIILDKPPNWESIQLEHKKNLIQGIYQYRKMLCQYEDPIFGNIHVKVDLFAGDQQRLPISLVTFDINGIYCTSTGLHSAFATLPPDTPEGSLEDGNHVQAILKEVPNGIIIAQTIQKGPDYARNRKLHISTVKKMFSYGYKIRGLEELVPISHQTKCSICDIQSETCFGCNACGKSQMSNAMCPNCFFNHCQESAINYSFWKCPFCRNERPILPSNELFQKVYDFIDLSLVTP